MEGLDEHRFRRLSPRHRDCLRLVYERKRTKEIAQALGLSVGTVSTYCSEAIGILDARDRIAAAEMFHAYEERSGGEPADPANPGAPSAGVGVGACACSVPHPGSEAPWWRGLLPIRTGGTAHNDLGFLVRIAWIPLLALVFVIGFGVLVDTLRVASELVRRG